MTSTTTGPVSRTHLSEQLFAEASLDIPGGVNSNTRAWARISPRSGHGAYFKDRDGNRYLDFHAAFGAIILGHAYKPVNQRVHEIVDDGVLYGLGVTELEVRLARRIIELVPSVESVLLSNTGNEATMHAVRVARAHTNRQRILKFQGSFNGGHDSVLRNILSPADRIGQRDPGSAGMLDAAVDATLVCRFNDFDQLTHIFETYGEQLAAVIVEPILHNAPTILPKPGFFEHLRALCTQYGVVLIFDELITGFRHDPGGCQALMRVMPDLTTMGKALGNGFPIAAVGGRREIMQRFNTNPDGDVFYGGTYNGNLVGVAAAIATLDELTTKPVCDHIAALGERKRTGLRAICTELDVPAHVSGHRSIYGLSFLERHTDFESYEDVVPNDDALQIAFAHRLLELDVFEMPARHRRNHMTFSHTKADIDLSLEADRDALKFVLRNHRR